MAEDAISPGSIPSGYQQPFLLQFARTIYLFEKLIDTHVYIYISSCQFWGPVLLPNIQTSGCITIAPTERGHPGDDHLGSGRQQDMELETPRATSYDRLVCSVTTGKECVCVCVFKYPCSLIYEDNQITS